MHITASILTDSLFILKQQLEMTADAGQFEVAHVDVMDGSLVDNITITPSDLAEVDFGDLKIDLHIQTDEPLDYLYEAAHSEVKLPIRAVIGQVEHMTGQEAFLEEVRKHEWKPGLSLDLYTPISAIDRESWSQLAFVQLMSIEMGAQGKTFNPIIFDKLEQLVAKRDELGLEFEILLDGGVEPEMLADLEERQVDGVCVGSYLWQADDFDVAVDNLFRHA